MGKTSGTQAKRLLEPGNWNSTAPARRNNSFLSASLDALAPRSDVSRCTLSLMLGAEERRQEDGLALASRVDRMDPAIDGERN